VRQEKKKRIKLRKNFLSNKELFRMQILNFKCKVNN